MIFESIDYWFAFQDFLFSISAGFVVAFFYQLLSIFLYKGKTVVFIKDLLICIVFSVVIFSYVISFTNYPIIRIYHILGGFLGFLAFPFCFSAIFHKFFEKIFSAIKNKILCCGKKVSTIVCEKRQKRAKTADIATAEVTDEHLKSCEVLLYNL